jgi:integrase/recombinase XerD
MTKVTPTRDSAGYAEVQKRLIDAGTSPRDKAFIGVLVKDGLRISEAIQLNESDIDFQGGTLTIVHLKERLKLKCPNCGELLGKRHLFCPGCGEKVDQATREKIEQRRQRVIPVDPDTLRLLDEYLKWRRKFPYRGPLVFPFTRQRGWQLVERIGRRAGIKGLHLHNHGVCRF